jgi:hypothetical protein
MTPPTISQVLPPPAAPHSVTKTLPYEVRTAYRREKLPGINFFLAFLAFAKQAPSKKPSLVFPTAFLRSFEKNRNLGSNGNQIKFKKYSPGFS